MPCSTYSEFITYKDNGNNRLSNAIKLFFGVDKKHLILISLTLLPSSCLELIYLFFIQRIIDKGMFFKDIDYIYLTLIEQLTVIVSRICLEFYRSWIFIHISTRISLSIITDFLKKILRLPLKFFNLKNVGDIIQRIKDNERIKDFCDTYPLSAYNFPETLRIKLSMESDWRSSSSWLYTIRKDPV